MSSSASPTQDPPTAPTAGQEAKLYKCVPVDWLWMPKPLRKALGYVTMCLFAWTFFSPLLCIALLFPPLWRACPVFCGVSATVLVGSFLIPVKEWRPARLLGQLWYEILDMHCNLSPEDLAQNLDYSLDHQMSLAMHPHGIVPFQAILWTAYCDQYYSDKKRGIELYGFGAAADMVQYVPLLRNILAWLTAGSATYKVLYDGIVHGIAPAANAAGRKPKHLYILPGGVAEIFTSTPRRHAIVFQNRRGLIKLSIATKCELVPCYVFGGTDFFNNLATDGGFFAALSRKMRAGVTIFWGPYGLPIPYTPKVTMAIGKPIPIPVVPDDDERCSKANDLVHAAFIAQMQELFEKYKAAAGYPDGTLEIL